MSDDLIQVPESFAETSDGSESAASRNAVAAWRNCGDAFIGFDSIAVLLVRSIDSD